MLSNKWLAKFSKTENSKHSFTFQNSYERTDKSGKFFCLHKAILVEQPNFVFSIYVELSQCPPFSVNFCPCCDLEHESSPIRVCCEYVQETHLGRPSLHASLALS